MSESKGNPEEANSIDIVEPANTAANRLAFKLRLTDTSGAALAGRDVEVELQGDGSFAINFSSKEIKRLTDEAGEATVVWFRRGIYGRKVRGTISGRPAEGEGTVAWEPTDDDTGPILSWTPENFRVKRR